MGSDEDIYTAYYMSQAGSGYSNIYSSPAFQRGAGIGKTKTTEFHNDLTNCVIFPFNRFIFRWYFSSCIAYRKKRH